MNCYFRNLVPPLRHCIFAIDAVKQSWAHKSATSDRLRQDKGRKLTHWLLLDSVVTSRQRRRIIDCVLQTLLGGQIIQGLVHCWSKLLRLSDGGVEHRLSTFQTFESVMKLAMLLYIDWVDGT